MKSQPLIINEGLFEAEYDYGIYHAVTRSLSAETFEQLYLFVALGFGFNLKNVLHKVVL